MPKKSFSEDAEENKSSILRVLLRVMPDVDSVLEIGSGTGQHAVCFGAALYHLAWQTSELEQQHASIMAWLNESGLTNVRPPIILDVEKEWPQTRYDAVFSANTAHILSWSQVEHMCRGVARVLHDNGLFLLYGPFNFGGGYTSASNERFDAWLRQRDPESGIRNFEDLNRLAGEQHLQLQEVVEMPVNNRMLIWRRESGEDQLQG
jgi:cyclopropane fatty-acyl-phospholipid synthase-like methyltransferase